MKLRVKRLDDNRRRYYLDWHYENGDTERLVVKSIPVGLHRELLSKYRILELTDAISYYTQKVYTKGNSVEDQDWYEHLLFKNQSDLKLQDNKLGEELCRITVMKTTEWFDSLTPQEWEWLYFSVALTLNHIPVREMYVEMYDTALSQLKNRVKADPSYQKAIDLLEDIKRKYESMEVKKNKSRTVSSDAGPKTVESVNTPESEIGP